MVLPSSIRNLRDPVAFGSRFTITPIKYVPATRILTSAALVAVLWKLSVSISSTFQLTVVHVPVEAKACDVSLVRTQTSVVPTPACVTQVGVPPVLSSICPDVPMARQTGVPTLDATNTAPLVGMLHNALLVPLTVLNVRTAPLVGCANRSTPAVDRISISPAAVSVSARTAVVFTHAAAPTVVCSIWPDVPMARHVGRPTLDATNTAPLVGILHDGAELAEL